MSTPRALILMYHRVGESPADPEEGDYALPLPLFESQLQRLARDGPPVVSLEALATGEYPERCVALSFDDGCDSDVLVALPRLSALGFPAVFFVNPATIGREGRLSWEGIRALSEAGFLVGSHGLDHTLLGDLSHAGLARQLVESKRHLEQRLGRPVEALSLPGGSGGERARRAALEAGYRLVLGSRPGLVEGRPGSRILPRLAVRRGHGLSGFAAAVEQRRLFLLRQALRYRVGRAARALMGTRAYGGLRLRWLENRRTTPWR